jgi:hypothetical protein
VLNAGRAPAIDMRSMTVREVTAYMRSNYDVAVNYLFPVLQHMRKQGGGLVAQTNSLAGFLGVSATRLLFRCERRPCDCPSMHAGWNSAPSASDSSPFIPVSSRPRRRRTMVCRRLWISLKRRPSITSCIRCCANPGPTSSHSRCGGSFDWL